MISHLFVFGFIFLITGGRLAIGNKTAVVTKKKND